MTAESESVCIDLCEISMKTIPTVHTILNLVHELSKAKEKGKKKQRKEIEKHIRNRSK